jgi:hypothetical protein
MHLVLCGTITGMRSGMDELRKRAEGSRYSFVFSDFEAVRYMGVRASFQITKELPPGRGFMVRAVSAAMVQMAMPLIEGRSDSEAQFSQLVRAIKAAYPAHAQWSYFEKDTTALDVAIKGEVAQPAVAAGAAPQIKLPGGNGTAAAEAQKAGPAAPAPDDQIPDWKKQMDALLQGIPKFDDVGQVDPSRMVSVVIEVPDKPAAPANGAQDHGGNGANAPAGNGTSATAGDPTKSTEVTTSGQA